MLPRKRCVGQHGIKWQDRGDAGMPLLMMILFRMLLFLWERLIGAVPIKRNLRFIVARFIF
jgi:hypothetical protein